MRTGWLSAATLVAVSFAPAVLAAGGGASESCARAGFSPGSADFSSCLARASEDDPLAALDGRTDLKAKSPGAARRPATAVDPLAALEPAKASVEASIKVPAAREELPASFSSPTVFGPPVSGAGGGLPGGPSLPPANQGGGWPGPTPPTAPTFPVITAPTLPWNMGGQ